MQYPYRRLLDCSPICIYITESKKRNKKNESPEEQTHTHAHTKQQGMYWTILWNDDFIFKIYQLNPGQ